MTDGDATRPADPIEPETKDWTWVLQRPCPECGLATAEVAVDQIPIMVRAYGARWAEVLRRPDAGVRPSPAVWSPLEYACHVRDGCRVFRARAELTAATEAIADTFALVEGEQWARRGLRSNRSVFTIETLAQYFVHDVAHHLDDVRG